MSVKDKLIDLYMEVAWDIVLRPELTNKQKIRILNNIIHDDIPSVEMLDKAGVWWNMLRYDFYTENDYNGQNHFYNSF